MKSTQLMPYRILEIGYFILEQMEYREWDINTLSEKSGINLPELNLLLNNKKTLTDKVAKSLSNVFGLSYQYWMNLDSNYKRNARTID